MGEDPLAVWDLEGQTLPLVRAAGPRLRRPIRSLSSELEVPTGETPTNSLRNRGGEIPAPTVEPGVAPGALRSNAGLPHMDLREIAIGQLQLLRRRWNGPVAQRRMTGCTDFRQQGRQIVLATSRV